MDDTILCERICIRGPRGNNTFSEKSGFQARGVPRIYLSSVLVSGLPKNLSLIDPFIFKCQLFPTCLFLNVDFFNLFIFKCQLFPTCLFFNVDFFNLFIFKCQLFPTCLFLNVDFFNLFIFKCQLFPTCLFLNVNFFQRTFFRLVSTFRDPYNTRVATRVNPRSGLWGRPHYRAGGTTERAALPGGRHYRAGGTTGQYTLGVGSLRFRREKIQDLSFLTFIL